MKDRRPPLGIDLCQIDHADRNPAVLRDAEYGRRVSLPPSREAAIPEVVMSLLRWIGGLWSALVVFFEALDDSGRDPALACVRRVRDLEDRMSALERDAGVGSADRPRLER